MFYILEAILVGFYTVIIYLILKQFIGKFYLILLIVGFLKHFLSGILGIHDIYCNYGDTCKSLSHNKYISNKKNLIRDSIIESLLFLILGFVLSDIIKKNRIILFFIIGFILHIVFEKLTLHKYYCQNICVVK